MATYAELYDRTNNSGLRNDIEMALLTKAQLDIDADGPTKAFSLTLLNHQTAQMIAQRVLRYLVVKYPDISDPTNEQVDTAVDAVFVKLAGG